MTARHAIARLKVTLEDVEPEVMRRLDVPLKIRLDRLHLVLAGASPILTSTMDRCWRRRRRSST